MQSGRGNRNKLAVSNRNKRAARNSGLNKNVASNSNPRPTRSSFSRRGVSSRGHQWLGRHSPHIPCISSQTPCADPLPRNAR